MLQRKGDMCLRFILCLICTFILMCMSTVGSAEQRTGDVGREITFTAAPYANSFNARVKECYDQILRQLGNGALTSIRKFAEGEHALVIKGREPSARLDALWVGPAGERPDSGQGMFIELSKGNITAPMLRESSSGNMALIGADEQGSAEFTFNLENSGNYEIWGKASGPMSTSDSFWVSIDGSDDFIWDIPLDTKGVTHWVQVKGRGIEYFSSWCFYFTWGATSNLSNFRDDQQLREIAMDLTLAEISNIGKRRVEPKGLWFLKELECVNMWKADSRTTRSEVNELMRGIQPQVDACYRLVNERDGWRDNTPNIQLQAAVILYLAASIWKDTDAIETQKWLIVAEECMNRAWKWKIPGGGFGYSYGSGIDACYLSYDSKHLSRYYSLTGDERVESALIDMAALAKNSTAYGHPLSHGSPWWKHCFWEYNSNKTAMLSEQILALVDDANYAWLVEQDRNRHLNGPISMACDPLMPYYNMQLQPVTRKITPLENMGFFSEVENGAAFRWNGLSVGMPWRSWSETTCGISYANSRDVVSQVCSVILTAVTGDMTDKIAKAQYPIAYSVVEQVNPTPKARAMICTKDFIASATSFRPALGGPALPNHAHKENKSPWLRTDIWFADSNGAAGSLELKALADNDCTRVSLWIHLSDNQTVNGNTIKVPGLTIELEDRYSSKIKSLGKVWGQPGGLYPIDLFEVMLRESGGSGFNINETFGASVAVNANDGKGIKISGSSAEGDIYKTTVLSGGKSMLMLFNASEETTNWLPDGQYENIIQSANNQGATKALKSSTTIILPPNSLTLCY